MSLIEQEEGGESHGGSEVAKQQCVCLTCRGKTSTGGKSAIGGSNGGVRVIVGSGDDVVTPVTDLATDPRQNNSIPWTLNNQIDRSGLGLALTMTKLKNKIGFRTLL